MTENSKLIKFTKMHALGNDFIVMDGINQSIKLTPALLQTLSDRHRGIGFDQCLLVERPISADTDFFYSIFNADGTEVGQCGNGARCVARFIHENKLYTQDLNQKKALTKHKNKYILATKTTQLTVEVHHSDENYEKITAELGVPRFISNHLETIKPININYNDQEIAFHAIDLGNPHAVIRVKDINNAPVEQIGELFKSAPFLSLFPEGVNVGFMEINNNHELKLRVYERGTGETQACGSGACAAMICARKFYHTDSTMDVKLPGGTLQIHWESDGSPVSITGNAVRVFDGVF